MMCLIINLVAPVGSYLALPHECWLICDQLLLPAIGSAIVVRPWPQVRISFPTKCYSPVSDCAFLSFASAMVATAVSRLYLRLNTTDKAYDENSRWYDSMYGESLFYDSCEMSSFRGKA